MKVNRSFNPAKHGKAVVVEFTKYINAYDELLKEYARTPNWRIVKAMRNIKKRERLTREFTAKMFELGVIT